MVQEALINDNILAKVSNCGSEYESIVISWERSDEDVRLIDSNEGGENFVNVWPEKVMVDDVGRDDMVNNIPVIRIDLALLLLWWK
ncbi:hypothetical protein V6N12_065594 [Hibiscus sabdariffa]|uniref:Uncharacterized protein n=1 Tax=Hibiscus sabdariffa TaxID=183260 RepID=A0ABR2G9D2_9ROSI